MTFIPISGCITFLEKVLSSQITRGKKGNVWLLIHYLVQIKGDIKSLLANLQANLQAVTLSSSNTKHTILGRER